MKYLVALFAVVAVAGLYGCAEDDSTETTEYHAVVTGQDGLEYGVTVSTVGLDLDDVNQLISLIEVVHTDQPAEQLPTDDVLFGVPAEDDRYGYFDDGDNTDIFVTAIDQDARANELAWRFSDFQAAGRVCPPGH